MCLSARMRTHNSSSQNVVAGDQGELHEVPKLGDYALADFPHVSHKPQDPDRSCSPLGRTDALILKLRGRRFRTDSPIEALTRNQWQESPKLLRAQSCRKPRQQTGLAKKHAANKSSKKLQGSGWIGCQPWHRLSCDANFR